MRRVRHSEEQVRKKLKEAEGALVGGASLQEVCHQLNISEATFHRWKKQHRDSTSSQLRLDRRGAKEDVSKRLKEMEKENKRLKQLVGQLMLDNALLKDALESKHRR